jgi:hypothetical protein
LIQRGRELRHGYTTIPWLAVGVELRDPVDGQTLVRAGVNHPSFTSMKQAREFAGASPPIESRSGYDNQQDKGVNARGYDFGGSLIVGSDGRKRVGLPFLGRVVLLAVLVVSAFVFAGLTSPTYIRWIGFLVGLGCSLALLLVIAIYATGVGNRRRASQMAALSALAPQIFVIAVRSTVELFGETRGIELERIYSKLMLTVGPTELALWSGKQSLTRVFSVTRESVHAVRSIRAHDTRGNEKPGVAIEFADSGRISV